MDMWTALGYIIPKYLAGRQFKAGLREQDARAYWVAAVDELYRGASRFTHPVKVENNTLYVLVYDHLWITELESSKYTLLQALKTRHPDIHHIVFRYEPKEGR